MLFFNIEVIAHFNERFSQKLPMKPMEKLINWVLRYFEERLQVSYMYLRRFLPALMFILVSNPTVSSKT